MRKGAGISGLSRQTATSSSYSALSSTLSSQQLSSLESSLASFRDALIAFAVAHRTDIRKDPAFRHQFQKMCSAIGVDPLTGGGRGGWWAESLGLGEWSCELALQIVDVCVSTRDINGGTIEMGELIARVRKMRNAQKEDITPDDVTRALQLLKPLKAGYALHTAGGVTFVRSVPRELDTDQSMLLVLASESGGFLDERSLRDKTGWSSLRAGTALDDCVMREGLGWIDDVDGAVWVVAAIDFED